MVIPARMIEALGVEPGDTLAAWIEGDQLIISSRQSVEKEPWAMFAGIEGSLADELIAERRADAKRELDDVQSPVWIHARCLPAAQDT